jgi:hypothetical protein
LALRAVWGGISPHAKGYHRVRLLIGFAPWLVGLAKRELQWLRWVGLRPSAHKKFELGAAKKAASFHWQISFQGIFIS